MNSLLSWLGRALHWLISPQAQPLVNAGTALAATLGVPLDFLGALIKIVGNLEAIGEIVKAQGGTKLDKLNLALPQVEAVLKGSEIMAGREIIDEALFATAVQEYVQATVDFTKSISEVKTEPK